MDCYRCWFANGAAVLIDAWTPGDAKSLAEDEAVRDGYPGASVVRVENLSRKESDE